MGYIIFEKHPSDLLKIENHHKHLVTIEIESFSLKVIGLIKPTSQHTFKVLVDIPSPKVMREAITNTLNEWLLRKEIVSYSLTDD
jgi:hypothetical protein